ncbi:MAG: response regulator [Gammaproteobacteria bacterium]|nr:response regulator [Gammaproteobacteria bacterium]
MAIPIIICDDSSVARKQLARALPQGWDVEITFACDGAEALSAVRSGKGEVLFLDLNMPGIDGYQVLQAIRAEDLPTMVIVVSGDVQPEARRRVMGLGALDFVEKPLKEGMIAEILNKYGIYQGPTGSTPDIDLDLDLLDGLKEIVNVAVGKSAELLARLLGIFVVMPVPSVKMINPDELRAAICQAAADDMISAACQGFVGSNISGEILIIFNSTSLAEISDVFQYQGESNDDMMIEHLTDMSSMITNSFLSGISEQLDIRFNQSYPAILGHHTNVSDISTRMNPSWDTALAIEMSCAIEGRHIKYELFLLFTKDSAGVLTDRISYAFG